MPLPCLDVTRFVHSGEEDLIGKNELLTEWLDLEVRCETVHCLPKVSPREQRMTAASTRRRTQFFMAPLSVSTHQLPRQITGERATKRGGHWTTFPSRSQMVDEQGSGSV